MNSRTNLKIRLAMLGVLALCGSVFASYDLTFDGGDGGIFDTGFTHTLPGTDGTNLALLNLTGGELIATTANGEPISNGTTEEYNYLAIPLDLDSPFIVYCKINNPQVIDNFDQGGLFVGRDADNWVKTTAVSFGGTNAISSIYEVGGNPAHGSEQFVAHGQINTAQTVELWLEGDGAGNVAAFYAIDGMSRNQTAVFHIPAVLGPVGFAGLWTTNAGLTGSGVYGTTVDIHYDHFSVGPELVGIEIIGPNEVAEDFAAQYKAIAHYEIANAVDVTNSASWSVEPNDIASISAGLLTTQIIDLPLDVTITAQYSEGENIQEAEKDVSIFAICPSGSALEFDGVDDYVSLLQPVVRTSNFTVMVWANHLGMAGGIEKTNQIFNQRDDLTGANHSCVTLVSEYPGFEPSSATATIRSSNGARQTLSCPKKDYGQWHNYAVTVSSDYLVFYIDGYEVNRAHNLQKGAYDISIDYVDIGRRRYNGLTRSFFNGFIDDVQIYNRALSAEEIQLLMHTRPDVDEPNLVGYWDFDEGEGQVAYDLSPYGNDGQLGSGPDVDSSDPNWVESDAPVGICTLDGLVERNISNVLDLKLEILDLLDIALGKEDALLDYMDDAFHNGQFDHLKKGDVVKAKQKIMGAIQQEEQAETAVDKSIEKLDDALSALDIELSTDGESQE